MRKNRFFSALFGVMAGACCLLSTPPCRAQQFFSVSLDTSSLIGHPAGSPFYLDFQLNDGSGAGDANNSAILSNFQFGGGSAAGTPNLTGGATGNLSSTVSLTDRAFLNEFFQPFNPGGTLSFNVRLTTNVDPGGVPDLFAFSILDSTLAPIPTTGPADALLLVNIDSPNPTIERFAGDPGRTPVAGGGPISLPAAGTAPRPPAVTIEGTLSNFDVVNRTGVPANDFRVTLQGVQPGQVQETYNNRRYGPGTVMGGSNEFETLVTWGPRAGVATPPGATEHFGVRNIGNPRFLRTLFDWTFDQAPVLTGGDPNMPQQMWDPVQRRTVDIINNVNGRPAPLPRWIQRRVNLLPRFVELEELVRDSPLFEDALILDPFPILLQPNEDLVFDDPFFDVVFAMQANLMMYDVFEDNAGAPGERIGTMLNAVNAQIAIPEPSTLALLGVGALGLLRATCRPRGAAGCRKRARLSGR